MSILTTASSADDLRDINDHAIRVRKQSARNSDGSPEKRRLSSRFMIDATSAVTAGALVAPLVTVIDQAVAERVSGRYSFAMSLKTSLRQFLIRPHTFVFTRPFGIMMLLYSSTYLTANVIDTISSDKQDLPASTTTSGLSKFSAVAAVNMSLALYKDSQFTRMFGLISPRPLPPASYALLALRDSLTIFASFNLPPKLGPILPDTIENHFSRLSVAKFITPAAMQVFNSPLHLWGLDLYNRNSPRPASDRLNKIWADWPATALARMCRVIPAFGVGGVVNMRTRARLMSA